MTARELLKFRRALIYVLGRERANARTRALIAYHRQTAAPDVCLKRPVQTYRQDAIRAERRRAYNGHELNVCHGAFSRGAWHCVCGAGSESECVKRVTYTNN